MKRMLLMLHGMKNCELHNQCGVFKHRGHVGNMSCVYTKPFGTQLPSPVQIYFLSFGWEALFCFMSPI